MSRRRGQEAPLPCPSGLAWNEYAYVANQPLTAADPLGLNGNGSTGCGAGQPADGPCPVVTFTVNAYAYPTIFVGTVATVNVYAGGPSPPALMNAIVTGVPYCSANPAACMIWGLSQHPNGPGPSGSWNNGKGTVAAAIAVPKGPSCSKLQRWAGRTSSIADTAAHTAGLLAFGTGIAGAISVAGEAPSGAADTPLTVALATATTYFGEASNLLGAGAAVLKSYANGNYQAMGAYDWTHLVAFAAELAASRIPGVSSYADTLERVADQGLDIAVTSPLVCQ